MAENWYKSTESHPDPVQLDHLGLGLFAEFLPHLGLPNTF